MNEMMIPSMIARARAAAMTLRTAPSRTKDGALLSLADLLDMEKDGLLAANAGDVADAEAAGRRPALVDRLRLTPDRVRAIADGVRRVVSLVDPVGQIVEMQTRPNGMRVARMRSPIGVILMIYEARPNVTIDAAALCVKAGNAAILRGGREARRSNAFLGDVLSRAGFPPGAVQVIADSDHALVTALLRQDGIDLVIPRGNEDLIRSVVDHARMPVLKHFKGVCHLFVDRDANFAMAERIAVNAKAQRPSVCNALETLLVDAPAARVFIPRVVRALRAADVEVRGDERTLAAAAAAGPDVAAAVVPAGDADWGTEYLDYIINVRVVDGAEFGLGAEIGISTDRIGPRGPMGVAELTSLKWVVLGSGQVRE